MFVGCNTRHLRLKLLKHVSNVWNYNLCRNLFPARNEEKTKEFARNCACARPHAGIVLKVLLHHKLRECTKREPYLLGLRARRDDRLVEVPGGAPTLVECGGAVALRGDGDCGGGGDDDGGRSPVRGDDIVYRKRGGPGRGWRHRWHAARAVAVAVKGSRGLIVDGPPLG